MGGILGDHAIPLRTIMRNNIALKRKWMYERSEVVALIRLVEDGILKIGEKGGVEVVGDFGLGEWEEACEVASREAGWDKGVVMRPGLCE